jgi:hypothetical protein
MDRSRRSGRARPGVEALESRQPLTGGAGSQFAAISGTIAAPGGTAAVPFAISPDEFTRPRGQILLGIDVSPDGSSAAKPVIQAVADPQGRPVRGVAHATYDPHVSQLLGGKTQTSAVLVPLRPGRGAAGPYTVAVAGDQGTSGGVRVGFYLAGDANGDGVVDPSDLRAIKAAMGAVYGNPRYTIDADADRDGVINRADLIDAQRNLGVRTTVRPDFSAQLDPSVTLNPADRGTTQPNLVVVGTATPGATVQLAEVNNQFPAARAQADASGQFRLTARLAPGWNAPYVIAQDAFGQKNEVGILPIHYSPPA